MEYIIIIIIIMIHKTLPAPLPLFLSPLCFHILYLCKYKGRKSKHDTPPPPPKPRHTHRAPGRAQNVADVIKVVWSEQEL